MIRILILTTSLFTSSAIADLVDHVPDGAEINEDLGVSRYYISTHAKPGSFVPLSPGHVYVSTMVAYDSDREICSPPKGFGQYPDNDSKSIKFKFGEGGVIEEELALMKPTYSLHMEVSKMQLLEVQKLASKWASSPYNLLTNNCIDFIDQISSEVLNLNTPTRFYTQFPEPYIQELIKLNADG
ncbi:hypothetical protein [Vibrio diabolicus]|uniref:hypothetical protein n=1 Tax=Vibrio diabolicus TaxID=50719 RepID=UPI0023305143|nr:hypothetical protein [Vibrio diabolicus]